MPFITHQSKIRTIRKGEPGFYLKDKFITTPRAGFEISKSCPNEYVSILKQAVNAGWIKPVANIYDHEQTFDLLKDVEL